MLRVTDCIADSTRPALPQPTEWQRVGKQCEAAMILMRELTRSAKPVGAWAGSQLWMFKGEKIWIVDAHGYGKRFIVRAEENLCIAKALPKQRQPRQGAIALRLPAGYSA